MHGLAPRTVLASFGVRPSRLRRVRRGRNTHWIVDAGSDRVVLRKYAAECSPDEVQYEVRLLQHLDRLGWPVPVRLAEPLTTDEAIWCLFSYLPGRALAPRSVAGKIEEQRQRGRLLARLHRDLADLTSLGQRAGWLRADEGLFRRPGWPAAGDVLKSYERLDPEGGRILREYSDRSSQRLNELLGDATSPIAIHGDFAPWNLRYAHGKLSGVLDFDLAHLDLRVADFALSWRGRYDAVILGYEDISPLEPVERELLVPVYWAWMIVGAVMDIDSGNGSPEWALTHLLRQPLD